MNSASVDLIYLDPPFNSKKNYAAPIGSEAAGAVFKDSWTWDDVDRVWLAIASKTRPALHAVIQAALLAHGKGMAAYVSMMVQRLEELARILKPTGSIYLHCDPTASHYLRLAMDVVFGSTRYLNEIGWLRTVPKNDYQQGAVNWPRMRDSLLHYAGSEYDGFNQPFGPLAKADKQYRLVEPETGRRYQLTSLTAPGAGTRGHPQYELLGVTRFWRYSEEKMQGLLKAGRVVQTAPGRVPRYKRYLDESKGVAIGDTWTDIGMVQGHAKERTGFPTQKPLALLRRIILASSREGDIVFDPFCGCATTCVAAEELDRQWVGIDISHKAAELVRSRLQKATTDRAGGPLWSDTVVHRTDLPQRTDLGKLPHYTKHKNALYGESGGYCGGCNVHFEKRNLTVDHIVPVSRGGTDHPENLWLLCAACNSSKGTKSQAEFIRDRMSLQGAGVQWLDQ